jgi:hypothetical protein
LKIVGREIIGSSSGLFQRNSECRTVDSHMSFEVFQRTRNDLSK